MPKGCYPRKSRVYPIESDSPIDDALTLERLGYSATTVSPSSTGKKVTFRCARCGEPVDRIRYRVKPGTLCRSCAHAKDDKPVKHPLKSGYEKVEVLCAGCGKKIKVRKMSLHEDSKCPSCRKLSEVVVNPYVDAEETQRRFGYDGAKVTAKSFDKVVFRCAKCGVFGERIRRNVTEEPVCVGCSHSKNDVVHRCLDDVETLKRFGYKGSSLAEKARRMVVFRCSVCGKLVERPRCNVHEGSRCDMCRYPAVLNPYIDVEKTQSEFGYDPNILAKMSGKRVMVKCAKCDVIFPRAFLSIKRKPLCLTCTFPPEDHPSLDDTETQKRFGYKASEVPRKSARKVVGRCVKCGVFFERARHNVTEEPQCKHHPFGKSEKEVRIGLEALIGRSLETHLILETGREVDIYDPVSKVGVEYCGLYWHNELKLQRSPCTYHHDKYLMCQDQGIDLITVFEDEWLQRPTVVLSIIAARMGAYTRAMGARACSPVVLSKKGATDFLDINHIQGAHQQINLAYGLNTINSEGEEELVAVMTFGPHHRQGHTHTVVLTRLCFAQGMRIVGGAQRLLKMALPVLQTQGYIKIVTWSDNRWFAGHVYENLGFVLEEERGPDYSYVERRKPLQRFSKQSQRKGATSCPEHMTEREWALERGLVRIWDCGRKRWVLSLA